MSGVTFTEAVRRLPAEEAAGCRAYTANEPDRKEPARSLRTRFSVVSVKIQPIRSDISPFA
jgi:hypothetical protein